MTGRTLTSQCKSVANGLRNGAMVRVVVSFDEETFDQIRSRAIAQQSSFAEQVRLLVEFGLEDVSA